MTEKRKSFFKRNMHIPYSPFKFFLSLLMAVILFACCSMSAGAAVDGNGSLSFSPREATTPVFLKFFNNYTEDGSDRDSDIPFVYEGNVTVAFNLARTSGSLYAYASGKFYFPVTFSTTSAGPSFLTYTNCTVSVVDVQAPDGVTVSSNLDSTSPTQARVYCSVFLSQVRVVQPVPVSVTFNIQVSGYAAAHSFGSSYGYLLGRVVLPSDYVDQGVYIHDSKNSFSQDTEILNRIDSNITSRMDILSSGLGNINTNISNQGNYIVNKIQNHITNDNSLAQNQIQNDNALAQNQIANDNSIAKNQITNDNNLSKNEIDSAYNNSVREINTANKNADDIMHSYDSGPQESDNKRFDDSQKRLQETEDNLFGSASDCFSGLDMSLFDIAKFTSVVSSLSFVSGLMQSLYTKMGDFGLIVTVGMVIMIASKVIGVYRFSTGDHGKGG